MLFVIFMAGKDIQHGNKVSTVMDLKIARTKQETWIKNSTETIHRFTAKSLVYENFMKTSSKNEVTYLTVA